MLTQTRNALGGIAVLYAPAFIALLSSGASLISAALTSLVVLGLFAAGAWAAGVFGNSRIHH